MGMVNAMTIAGTLPAFITPSEWLAEKAADALTSWKEFGRKACAVVSLPFLLTLLVWTLWLTIRNIRRSRSTEHSDARWLPQLGQLHAIHDGLSVIIEHLERKNCVILGGYALRKLPDLREDLGDIIEAIELGQNPQVRNALLHDVQSIKAGG